jgi:hypothetical protein
MTSTKRTLCTQCLRPQRTCICTWIRPIEHDVEVLILQHPLEIDNAKGSARLLHLSLPHSQIMTGEVFVEDELRELLYAPLPHQDGKTQNKKKLFNLYCSIPALRKTATSSSPRYSCTQQTT